MIPDNEASQNSIKRSRSNNYNDPETKNMDLTDSKDDEQHLLPDEAVIDLPDVKDIPGQEFIQPPPLGMMADTTISSADEEGEGLFDDDEEDETDL